MPPEVSFIVPFKDAQRFIKECAESILAQTFPRFEALFIDDGSNDASAAIVRSFRDPRIRLLKSQGKGLVDALNTGVFASEGSYIARLDADDIAAPTRLAQQLAAMKQAGNSVLCFSDVELINESGKPCGSIDYASTDKQALLRLLMFQSATGKPIVHPSVLMPAKTITSIGGYREFTHAEDRDLWIRLAGCGDFTHISQRLTRYRIHAQNVSATNIESALCSSIAAVASAIASANHPGAEVRSEHALVLRQLARTTLADPALQLHVTASVIRTSLRRGRHFAALRAALTRPRALAHMLSKPSMLPLQQASDLVARQFLEQL